MPSKILDYDSETKTREVMHFDVDGQEVIQSIQDCGDVLRVNKALDGNLDKKKDWWMIGSIPLATCQKWAAESGVKVFSKEWQEVAKKKVNSPEYSKLNPNRIRV